ncbi:MAG: response regulator [Ignavibacteriae bacterium]|nr:response regulator [Ignavibacteriota bacterium]NOG97975.1 response regulator [Ignavibacteriota bacterium]
MDGKNILVIDDEQLIIDSVEKIVSLEDITVDYALTAETALEKMKTGNYNLILTDIMMPEMDGFQLLEKMRLTKIDIPVIMTTGYSTGENAIRALHDGALAFIPKPFDIDELISIVKRGIKFSELQNSIKDDQSDTIAYVPCPSAYYRLGYTSWIRFDGEGIVAIGITDCFLNTITKIKEIEFLHSDLKVFQGTPYAKFIDENELPNPVLSPLSGTIIKQNEQLKTNIPLVEKDPYFDGWIYKVLPDDLDNELKKLTPCSSDRL